jgi:ABC-2 type transport system ATP-binding protein
MAENLILQLNKLNKIYPGGTHAVIDLDYTIPSGALFALLGPNGAGKSTMLGMICGLRIPTSGKIAFAGIPVKKSACFFRSKIGVVSQHANLELDLSGYQNLYVHGLLYDMPRGIRNSRIASLLALANLEKAKDNPVRSYSGGMKRKLQIIRALLHDPVLLILDEPTVGLDPASREAIWDMVLDLNRNGKTVLFSTHYMEEAQRYAQEVSIIHQGIIIQRGAPHTLIRELGEWCRISYGNGEKDIEYFQTREDAVKKAKLDGRELIVRRTTLEDVFISLTGKELK